MLNIKDLYRFMLFYFLRAKPCTPGTFNILSCDECNNVNICDMQADALVNMLKDGEYH